MTHTWDAHSYSDFLDLRTRPARDLLDAIPHSFQPKTVYDLGCGPGNSTILLKKRWPQANIVGLDSSVDMLHKAQTLYPNIHFVQENIAHFTPIEKIDCFFANASLQWLDDHATLIPKLFQFLSTNGVFAFQIPNNFHSPLHQNIIKVLQNFEWQHLVKKLRYGKLEKPLYQINWYYDLLTQAGGHSVQLWQTEYYQEMSDYSQLYSWIKGTVLRPVLLAMNTEEQNQFTDSYIQEIKQDYLLQKNHKILLPFKRLFLIAYRSDNAASS